MGNWGAGCSQSSNVTEYRFLENIFVCGEYEHIHVCLQFLQLQLSFSRAVSCPTVCVCLLIKMSLWLIDNILFLTPVHDSVHPAGLSQVFAPLYHTPKHICPHRETPGFSVYTIQPVRMPLCQLQKLLFMPTSSQALFGHS